MKLTKGKLILTCLRLDDPAAIRLLKNTLRELSGDVGRTAKRLGVSRSSLYAIPAARAVVEAEGMGRAAAGGCRGK